MGELAKMINHGQINLDQYFTMHPFSATEKMVYDQALTDINFFDNLYIKSCKTYERFATVSSVINNAGKNLIVITGYRGCGKTNFLRLIKYVFEGGNGIVRLDELLNQELESVGNNEELRKIIRKNYEKTIETIYTILNSHFYDMNEEELCKEYSAYICGQFKGECRYINFDEGGMGRKKPFSAKLFYLIRESIEENKKSGRITTVIKLLSDFISKNKWVIEENFENIEYPSLRSFWKEAKVKLHDFEDDDFYDWLLDELKKLSLEQLLFAYTMWEYAEIIVTKEIKTQRKLVYLLDNIDIISDGLTDIFHNTMMGVWQFIWDTRIVFSKIRENKSAEDEAFIELYDKTKFIVAMRETTAMHISGHLRDKMRGLMEHFDMSTDVDKTMIMQRKIDMALEMIEKGEITHKGFIEEIKCLNELISDRIFMKALFQLHNNDYRTSAISIITICKEHISDVKHAITLMHSDDANAVFGGRGIIYRLIIEAFFEWNYFSAIGVEHPKHNSRPLMLQNKYGYSCARIILTILCNKQAKIPERFFVNPEESVRLSEMMDIDDFITIIDGMFSLRNKKYWNHLVTFDNILHYSPDVVKKYLLENKAPQTEDNDIYVRATSAGMIYASTLCVHYEYFSSRFATMYKGTPLFLLNVKKDSRVWTAVKKNISEVYNAVKVCCESLEVYNILVLKALRQQRYEEIVASPYYYEKQFHEERIIHNHISYLEAYRQYLLKLDIDDSRIAEMNSFLITVIKDYLDLLKYDVSEGVKTYRDIFISQNSKNLYNELNVCIEAIDKCRNVRNDIGITRDYYKMYYKDKECEFIRKAGLSDRGER